MLNKDRDIVIKDINKKKKKLRFIAKELKKHFVGLDPIIDRIIKNIETWYIMPQLLSRPVIIALFGCTGVGKSDLVSRLVKLLNFQDRFCAIEMSTKGSATYPWANSIASILSSHTEIEDGKQSIILLDEIQNFRTVDEDGCELQDYKFKDVFTLLSDGKLPSKDRDQDYMVDYLFELDREEKRKEKAGKLIKPKVNVKINGIKDKVDDAFNDDYVEDETIKKDEEDEEDEEDSTFAGSSGCDEMLTPERVRVSEQVDLTNIGVDDDDGEDNQSYYSLKRFKDILRLSESVQEIAKWSNAKKKEILIQRLNSTQIYEPIDYTKSLIFISGNLDEAYEFLASKTDEVDVDADIYHDLSAKINILDIKKALTRRFKPEQIARFGNMHIIYPTLSKKSYETIIVRKVAEIVGGVKDKFGITVEVDKSILDLVYKNGVFPAQGTRPVFSTISEIVECPLPTMLLNAFIKNCKKVRIYYNKSNICAEIKETVIKHPFKGAVDNLKRDNNKSIDKKTLYSVHEAGHAIIYASLFGLAPVQLTALPASKEVGGFMWTHEICGSKASLEKQICVNMAGNIAERMVFGENNYTSGALMDLQEATKMAGQMVKRLGMDTISSVVTSPHRSDLFNTDLDGANPLIENIIKEMTKRTEKELIKNKSLFINIVSVLLERDKITPETFRAICKKNGMSVKVKKSDEMVCGDYNGQFKKFKKLTEKKC